LVSGSTTPSVPFGALVTVNGASRVCPGTCQIVGNGMLAGPGANRIGFTYKIASSAALNPGFGNPINAGNLIHGAAVFARR
jgi:hypothetical protein